VKPAVYLETTIISYLAARPSRNLVVAAQQRITSQWWSIRRTAFELVISDAVFIEASRGDRAAATRRLLLLDGLRRVPLDDRVRSLARRLLSEEALPGKAAQDALHVAAAAAGGARFLLTWNCTHIANATMRPRIELICRAAGHEPPIICTPTELIEAER
jgi:hypothetical protein